MVDTAIYQQYLQQLKSTVEGLLVTQVANVWSIYGGLNRLYLCLEKIFRHGCRNGSQEGSFYNFIQGLEWLQPETSKSYFTLDCEYRPHVPALIKDDKSSIWLYRSIESHSLSAKLSWLFLDNSHLQACYEPWAFLCQKEYVEATLVCLRAVERNQATFLSEINPCLFLKNTHSKEFVKAHRRCFSFPDNHLKFCANKNKNSTLKYIPDSSKANFSPKIKEKRIFGKLKPWSSLPALQIDSTNKIKSKRVHFESRTMPNTPVHTKKISPSLLKVDYNALQSKVPKTSLKRSTGKFKGSHKDIKRVVIINSNIIEHTPSLSNGQSTRVIQSEDFTSGSTASTYERGSEKPKSFMSQSPLSMVEYSFLPMQGEKDYSRNRPKSFIEDGGMSILPMATGYFPKPTKGQSLTSFLTSSKLARSNAELDRENAHFSISEAIISAMEKLKCQYKNLGLGADERFCDSDDSIDRDPEIVNLKQRIRLRRGQKILESRRRQWAASLLSDGKTVDTATTTSPNSTPPDSSSEVTSSEEVDDLEIDQANNLKENQGLSMSMASLYSDADIMKKPRGTPDGASDILSAGPSDVLSAEGVALSLISKFNEKHLPKASDLEWLVSEEEAPQALLPLPKSWPVSPDDCEGPATPLRGTRDWAPPRPQIVLTLHPAPLRKSMMEKQNYRCAGCGMRVATKYASKFRYCDYLGKYFCTGCHKNQVALIPARVLYKWDFNRYPVSTFSYKLLEQMYADPLFRIFELNKNMTKLFKNLEFIRKYRLGLCYLKEYIFTCRFGETIQERLEQDLPPYFLARPEEYSLDDLVNIKSGEMKTKLKFLVDICCRHTSECKLCLARGYICEICKVDEVIFPWQMRIVTRCSKCFTCYHLKCWNPSTGTKCPKCERKSKWKESASSGSSQ